jgi:DNA-directed RNA polymerase subunit RPC12/RpoP
MFQCTECNETFEFLGRISEDLKPVDFVHGKRVLESPACPFCGSKKFVRVPDT